jgi:hypothetical protein
MPDQAAQQNRHITEQMAREMAYDRLQLSAERGLAISQYMMGEVARSGTLFPPNDELARSWYQKAALQGHGAAIYQLGLMYRDGRGGLPQDDDEFRACLHKAAQQGTKQAIDLLAQLEDA